MSDIVDRIDELVNESLSRPGHEVNVNQDKCPHCRRNWHGLRITQRIAEMSHKRYYEEDYSYADDDSEVLCEGSAFIGPMKNLPIGRDFPTGCNQASYPIAANPQWTFLSPGIFAQMYQTIMGLL